MDDEKQPREREILGKISELEREFQTRIQALREGLKESSETPANHVSLTLVEDPQKEQDKPSRLGILALRLDRWRHKHARDLRYALVFTLSVCFMAYFCYAMYHQFGDEGSLRLLAVVVLVTMKILIAAYWTRWGKYQWRRLSQKAGSDSIWWKRARFIAFTLLLLGVLVYIVVDVSRHDPSNLQSLLGVAGFVLCALVTSKSVRKVKWRIVLVGLSLQLILALFILRTSFGVASFQWLGDRVTEFITHTDAGSKFVFGDNFQEHYLAFVVIPVVVFCSSVIAVLYYLGAMQWIIIRFSWVIQHTMGTTAGESVIAAGNIFFGSAEAPLLIKPLLTKLTTSELHAVMTCGFATISGSVLAAYIFMGVPANHLLSASIMSAPAALAMAKLCFPELGRSVLKASHVRKNLGKSSDQSVLEAASSGAVAAVPLVAGIVVNLIAFVAILDLVDQTLGWVGDRVGLSPPDYPPLSVRLISSYCLWPLAYLMGCPAVDCRKVASLLGIRAFLSEFISYQELGTLIANRQYLVKTNYTGRMSHVGENLILLDDNSKTLVNGVLSEKSEVVCTYALCGFAGCIGLGIMLGVMTGAVPSRKAEISRHAVRAVWCGTLACYLTASIAGLLFTPTTG